MEKHIEVPWEPWEAFIFVWEFKENFLNELSLRQYVWNKETKNNRNAVADKESIKAKTQRGCINQLSLDYPGANSRIST